MVRPQTHRLAAGVALTEVLIAFNMGEKNKILMFLPIVEVVAQYLAWAIGEVLGDRDCQLSLWTEPRAAMARAGPAARFVTFVGRRWRRTES